MKRNTPLITLLAGAALGIALLIASMQATPAKAPAGYTATATPAATVTPAAPATPATAPPSGTAPTQAASPAPTATAYANAPIRADYAGEVRGGGASIAISIHGTQAIAYVCNGSVIEAWLKGTAAGGRLIMTGKNHAKLTLTYSSGAVTGYVVAHGSGYSFSVPTVHKPSGLYEATAVVRGATIKAGWIVLPNGTQVGALEGDANAPAPSAVKAPALDLATGTARDGDIVLHATQVSGVTGIGF